MNPKTTIVSLPGFLNGATITQKGETAIIYFDGIDSADHVRIVFEVAAKIGARRGSVFTGPVVDPHLLAMYERHAADGSTHLGGRVVKLFSGNFRLDFDEFPVL